MHNRLLVCLVIASFRFQGSLQHCPKVTDCTASFGALRLISHGVDLTTLNLFPSNGSHPTPTAEALFQLSCANQSNTWKNDAGCLLQFPDQIEEVAFKSSGDHLENPSFIEVIKKLGQYRDQLEESTGVGGIPNGVMSNSEHFRNWQRWLLKEDKTGVFYEQHNYRLETFLKSATQLQSYLTVSFNQASSALVNQSFAKTPKPFYAFLETFGTHYFARVNFGRYFHIRLLFDDTYAQKMTSVQLRRIATGYLNETIKIPLTSPGKAELADAVKVGTAFDFKLWGNKSMWMIGGTQLEPISKLIADPDISEQVDLAIENKMIKASLTEWKFSLDMIHSNMAKSWMLFPSIFAISTLLSEINDALKQTILKEERFEKIRDKVKVMVDFAGLMKGDMPKSE